MQRKTILNRVERFKSFVYGKARWVEGAGGPRIEVEIEARKNGRPICSGCGQVRAGYDRLPPRRFAFVPLWGIAVFFVYAMRRVSCPECGVKVEKVPWCDGKNHLTITDRWFLARWAKQLSWQAVACAFRTTWENVFRSVKYAVSWGLAHRDLTPNRGHRHRRDPVAAKTPLPDIGLPDRRRTETSVVDGRGADGRESAGTVPDAQRGGPRRDPLRVQATCGSLT